MASISQNNTIKDDLINAIPFSTDVALRNKLITAISSVLETHVTQPNTTASQDQSEQKPKRGRPRKYFTEEERQEAIRRQKREYKQRLKLRKQQEKEEQARLSNTNQDTEQQDTNEQE